MPMQKLGSNFLTAGDITDHGSTWKILTAPELKEVEFEGKKSNKYEINIQSTKDKEERTWQMNPTTSDYLQKQFTDNERNWINKTVEIEVYNSVINGKSTPVMYAKGAIKKK